MMNTVFDACVQLLLTLAEWTGLTYKEINVWIFVILWPLLTIGLMILAVCQRRRIQALEKINRRDGGQPRLSAGG
jgi:hypothetical protein